MKVIINKVIKFLDEFFKNHEIISLVIIMFFSITMLILIVPNAVKYYYPDVTIGDTWVSFFGSYLGGLFGGIVTLIALYITVKQTREIQQENRLEQEKNERRHFVAEIENLVGEYLADIGIYFYSQTVKKKMKGLKIDRSKSILYYRLLKIKLAKIECAKNLIKLLDDIHNNKCFFRENQNKCITDIFNDWETELNKLSEAVREFGDDYINMKKNNYEYKYQTTNEILKKFFELYNRLLNSEEKNEDLFWGFSKAFEVLLKDYLKHKYVKKSKKIEEKTIYKLSRYIKNKNLKKLVNIYKDIINCKVDSNEESKNNSLSELKELIKETLKYIEADLNLEKYLNRTKRL